ncbi:S10 family peptidase [Acidicapsa dinghuensis]|uniref:S10 family peptidase n=1 Tax=Acidicapsa dinghuensis TaxID=2218256 RepID=A0ABW1ED14_9BACT|nr:peptidase S10 [Acidicapsa dinghuensis]
MKWSNAVKAGAACVGMLMMVSVAGAQAPSTEQRPEITVPPGQQPQQGGQRQQQRPRGEQAAAENEGGAAGRREGAAAPAPEEKTVVTHHSARIGGQTINYTATTGTYVIRADNGTPKATFFYVAYTKDGVTDPASRPVSFVYNGGPGSASLFTHMGFGPKRVVLTPDGQGMEQPYRTVDNEDSFLDATDLVFIDAVSTGYSRPVAGQTPSQFYGIIEDANYFSDFIYQYLNRAERWLSPKYLIGESYGTTRSAELSGVLQERHEIYLDGIVLVSSVAFTDVSGDDRSAFFLPTYVTSAWYHHLLAPDLEKLSIEEVAQQARDFAHGEYAQTLEKGDLATADEKQKTIADMARLTGLSPKYIEESNLRVSPQRWFKELERDKRKTVGRLDSRFEGYDVDAAGERVEYDTSEASYLGAYAATFHDYVRRELGWKSDEYYTITANVRPWDQTGNTQVAEVLRSAMTSQRHLKVLVVCGYYDLATPFNGIERTVDHMHLEPEFRKNLSFSYYESGHMVYIDEKAHHKLHKDVDGFIESSYVH